MFKQLNLLSLILVFLVDCGTNPDSSENRVKEYLRTIDIGSLSHYEIKNIKSFGGWGDYYELITLVISKDDYVNFERTIRGKPNFVEYDSTETPVSAQTIYDKKVKFIVKPYSYEKKIFYEYFDTSMLNSIVVVLYNDSLMDIEYNQR